MKLLIVGHGFVGKAVDYGFSTPEVVKTVVDPIYKNSSKLGYMGSLDQIETGMNFDFIFVCVPTPMSDDGAIDARIFNETIHKLKKRDISGTIVVKSTLTPDIIEPLQRTTPRIVYNPEFLREKTAIEDFVNPPMHVLGGEKYFTDRVQAAYENYSNCKPCPVYHMTAKEASFVKYGVNTFLATKVLWFNQFYELIKRSALETGGGHANYAKIINAITTDNRIGRSHTVVPGFDGKLGFGGACFPKDTQALINYDIDGVLTVLDEVVRSNNEYRSEYDLDERENAQNVVYHMKKA